VGVAEHAPASSPVHVHYCVPGECTEQRPELVEPPWLGVADEEVHVAAEPPRGDEQRDEDVRQVVEHVPRVAADGEDDRRGGVAGRASGSSAGGVMRMRRRHRHLSDAGERVPVVLPAVRLHPP